MALQSSPKTVSSIIRDRAGNASIGPTSGRETPEVARGGAAPFNTLLASSQRTCDITIMVGQVQAHRSGPRGAWQWLNQSVSLWWTVLNVMGTGHTTAFKAGRVFTGWAEWALITDNLWVLSMVKGINIELCPPPLQLTVLTSDSTGKDPLLRCKICNACKGS